MNYNKELLIKYETDVFIAGGGAAGVAAAVAAAALAVESGDVREVSIKELSGALLKLGAYLPSYKS